MAAVVRDTPRIVAPAIDALDASRRPLVRFVTRLLPGAWRRREPRTVIMAAALSAFALAAALSFPLWMIALGPIALGVPHVLADLRYLVVRPAYHRRPALVVSAALGIGLAATGLGLRGALVGGALAVLSSRASAARKCLGLLVVAALFALAVRAGFRADVVLLHAHNAIAVVFVLLWRKPLGAWRLALFAAWALATALVLSGSLDMLVHAGLARAPAPALSAPALMHGMTRDIATDAFGARLLACFAFGQSVHYIAWLRLVPDLDRPSPSPRSFRQSERALRRDLPRWVLVGAGAAMVALVAWAVRDLAGARDVYLMLAFWHVYAEIIVLALFVAEGRPASVRGQA